MTVAVASGSLLEELRVRRYHRSDRVTLSELLRERVMPCGCESFFLDVRYGPHQRPFVWKGPTWFMYRTGFWCCTNCGAAKPASCEGVI